MSGPLYGRRMNITRKVSVLGPIAVLVLLASACGGKTVTVPSDKVGCVFESAQAGRQFVRSIQPGERVDIGGSDDLVLLPTTDQLYNMTTSPSRTALAPSRVLAFTRGQTAVWVEGVLKFRFNTVGDRACKWYAKFGLQGAPFGDLGFAARQKSAQRQTGWYRFLAEAHGDTMRQVVHDGSSAWTWQQLAYGSDPTLKVKRPADAEPISVEYGKHIGALFSKYLALNLGDTYFCGVQPGLTGSAESACPPVYFQILSVYPRDASLEEEHDKLKQLDAALARQRQGARLKAQNRAIAIASARAQRKVLEAQLVNSRLEAQNDLRIQKCLILARVGLDCDGHKQQIVVAGLPRSGK